MLDKIAALVVRALWDSLWRRSCAAMALSYASSTNPRPAPTNQGTGLVEPLAGTDGAHGMRRPASWRPASRSAARESQMAAI
jgi:hypothetical protein